MPIPERKALAFIVEGDGEYQSFPQIAARLDSRVGYPAVNNAKGYGRITKRLEEMVASIILTHRPHTIICTIDEVDVVPSIYERCVDLVADLGGRYQAWCDGQGRAERFHPLPDKFVVVVQRRKLETWLCADPLSLRALPVFLGIDDRSVETAANAVHDDAVNPDRLLKAWSNGKFDSKDPIEISAAFRLLDLDVVAHRSRSFLKFKKEVMEACDRYWG